MGLVERVTNITMRPKTEWPVIAAESATIGGLYSRYIIPLAAIGPVCSFLSAIVFGQRIPFTGIAVHPPLGSLLGMWILSYILSLVAVAVVAVITQKLAPTFQSTPDLTAAFKVVVFSQVPFWVAGVLHLIPLLGVLTILVGLYGLYLMYLGLPVVMGTPQEKVLPYLVVIVVVAIVLSFVVGAVSTAIFSAGALVAGR